MQIGRVDVPEGVLLAPLAGISSLPFRLLNRRFGCECAFTEMISARSLHEQNRYTQKLLSSCRDDRPLGVQLFGNDSKYLTSAMECLCEYPHDILDLNAACPQRKIVSDGKGAALLKTPKRLQELLTVMVRKAVVPVTVKIRLGWNTTAAAADIARRAEDAGVSAIIVHGRTRAQLYSGTVDYAGIQRVKQAVAVPVIASGDIFSGELAQRMFRETGCDGVAVARGSFGNPWIFRQISAYIKNEQVLKKPPITEIAEVMRDHFKLVCDFYGEEGAVVEFRKFYIWYTKGFRGVRRLRHEVARVKSVEQMFSHIEKFCETVQTQDS